MKVMYIKEYNSVRIDGGGENWFEMTEKEAIQLAKDLLIVCGVPCIVGAKGQGIAWVSEPPVFSGMSLDEIQERADTTYKRFAGDIGEMRGSISNLANLIANLAAKVKELNLAVQSKKAIDAFKESETYRKIQEQNSIQFGETVTCSCGNVFRVF